MRTGGNENNNNNNTVNNYQENNQTRKVDNKEENKEVIDKPIELFFNKGNLVFGPDYTNEEELRNFQSNIIY
jgi:hypothetical protein